MKVRCSTYQETKQHIEGAQHLYSANITQFEWKLYCPIIKPYGKHGGPTRIYWFLRAILDATPDYVCVLDKDGIFRYANRVAAGLDKSKVIGSSIYDYVGHENVESVKKHIKQAFNENKIVHYQTTGVGPNNTKSLYATSLTPIMYGGEQMVLTIASDISLLKNSEEELKEKIKELEKLNHAMIDREIKMIELKKEIDDLRGGG